MSTESFKIIHVSQLWWLKPNQHLILTPENQNGCLPGVGWFADPTVVAGIGIAPAEEENQRYLLLRLVSCCRQRQDPRLLRSQLCVLSFISTAVVGCSKALSVEEPAA
jgi:hypothetical protein